MTVLAAFERGGALTAPAGMGPPVAEAAGRGGRLRVWGAPAGAFAVHGSRAAIVSGEVHNAENLARHSGLTAADCRARPAVALLAAAAADATVVDALRGAFWIALVDLDAGLVRLRGDELGRRTVLYTALPGAWVWSGELPPLVAWGNRRRIDAAALPVALHYRRLLGSRTLVEGVSDVPPWCEVTLEAAGGATSRRWEALRFSPEPPTDPLTVWVDRLDAALAAALARVRRRHARVGVLLSGGLDSALLAAYAQRAGFTRLVAYTADIEGTPNVELERARMVAAHLGVELRVVRVTDAAIAARADAVLRRIQVLPRNNSDFVLEALLAAAAGEVDAVLYGEAADGLFGPSGLALIPNVTRKRRPLARVPRVVQRLMADAVGAAPGRWARRLAALLRYTPEERVARLFLLEGHTPASRLVPDAPFEPEEAYDSSGPPPRGEGLVEWLQRWGLAGECRIHWHALQRLADPYGISVEAVFTEREVLDVALRLPTVYKHDDSGHKPAVRALAARHTPAGYVALPKLGFPVPAQHWLEGPLRSWVDAVREPDARVWSLLDRRAFDALRWPADFEHVWTVAALERFIRLFLDPDAA